MVNHILTSFLWPTLSPVGFLIIQCVLSTGIWKTIIWLYICVLDLNCWVLVKTDMPFLCFETNKLFWFTFNPNAFCLDYMYCVCINKVLPQGLGWFSCKGCQYVGKKVAWKGSMISFLGENWADSLLSMQVLILHTHLTKAKKNWVDRELCVQWNWFEVRPT